MEVIILAGGLGTRLREVVSEVPKCMAPIGEADKRPFLAYLLDYLKTFQVDRVVLSVGYLRSVIMEWVFAHGSDYPFAIDFAVEETPLGTGGALKLALSQCHGDSVAAINGDTLFNIDLDLLFSQHKANDLKSKVTIALKPMSRFDRYGTVTLTKDDKVISFNEKKYCKNGLINGGVYIISRSEVLKDMQSLGDKFSFERDILVPFCDNGNIYGFIYDNYFLDIGIPEDFRKAQYELKEFCQNLEITTMDMSKYTTLLLDRDGVINRQIRGGYVTCWEEFEFMPGIYKTLCEMSRKFKHIFVVTNQRGVGKGVFSQKDLDQIHAMMVSKIAEHGGRIDQVLCCTSTDDNDPFRKPNAGLFHEACYYHPDIVPERTLMIGDSESDEIFARNCGIDFIQIKKF